MSAQNESGSEEETKFNKATKQRITRALEQRLFVIERKIINSENTNTTNEEFVIQGTTGNLYKCKIANKPTCDCPDSKRGHVCKHLLFIYIRVLRVEQNNSILCKKNLSDEEIANIYSSAPKRVDGFVMAESFVREKYKTFLEQSGKPYVKKTKEKPKPRKPLEGDMCAVCYEDFGPEEESKTTYCLQCSNNIHIQCWNMWKNGQTKNTDSDPTCVYCRAVNMGYKTPKSKRVSASGMGSGYVNVNQLF